MGIDWVISFFLIQKVSLTHFCIDSIKMFRLKKNVLIDILYLNKEKIINKVDAFWPHTMHNFQSMYIDSVLIHVVQRICSCLMIQLNSVETIQLVISSIIQFQRDLRMIDRNWLFLNFMFNEIVIVFIWIFDWDYEESFHFIQIQKNRKISFNHQMKQFQ